MSNTSRETCKLKFTTAKKRKRKTFEVDTSQTYIFKSSHVNQDLTISSWFHNKLNLKCRVDPLVEVLLSGQGFPTILLERGVGKRCISSKLSRHFLKVSYKHNQLYPFNCESAINNFISFFLTIRWPHCNSSIHGIINRWSTLALQFQYWSEDSIWNFMLNFFAAKSIIVKCYFNCSIIMPSCIGPTLHICTNR